MKESVGLKGLMTLCIFSVLIALIGCDQSPNSTNHRSAIMGIAIDPAEQILSVGETYSYKAYAIQKDLHKTPITKTIEWGVSDKKIASIDQRGNVVAIKAGRVGVTASYQGKTATVLLTIKKAKLQTITLMPEAETLHLGESKQYTAMGAYADNSVENLTNMVRWESSTPEIVSINSQGIVQAKLVGSHSKIKATKLGVFTSSSPPSDMSTTGKTSVKVNGESLVAVSIQPSKATMHLQQIKPFFAEGLYSDGSTADITDQAKWTVVDKKILQMDTKGLMTGQAAGMTSIKASYRNQSASAIVDVKTSSLEAIEIKPAKAKLHLGEQQQYYATAIYTDKTTVSITRGIRWESQNPDVIVMTQQGLGQAINAGTSEIKVIDIKTKIEASTLVKVDKSTLEKLVIIPRTLTLPVGTRIQLDAQGTYKGESPKNVTQDVTWAIDNQRVAQLGPHNGQFTAKAEGTTTVTASLNGKLAQSTIEVTEQTLEIEEEIVITTIDSVNGNMVAKPAAGKSNKSQATDTSAYNKKTQAKSAIKSLFILPDNTSTDFVVGDKKSLGAIGVTNKGRRANVTQKITWESQSPNVLQVIKSGDKAGQVTALSEGSAIIKATEGKTTASMRYQVVKATLESISIQPENLTIPIDNTINYRAMGRYSDGKQREITDGVQWSSGDRQVAAIQQNGKVSPDSMGATTISANIQGKQGETELTVTFGRSVKKIIITPETATIGHSSHKTFKATAVFSNNTELDITQEGQWRVSDLSTAGIGNTPWLYGRAWSLMKSGKVTVSNFYKGVKGTATLIVK